MKRTVRDQRGQVALEYVLLLGMTVVIVIIMIDLAVSRTPGDEGFLIKSWNHMVKVIAEDYPDDPT